MEGLPEGFDLCQIGAAVPPKGTVSNLIDPVSLSHTTIAICVVMITMSTSFVAARFYVNFRHLRAADYVMLAGLAANIALVGLTISVNKYNRHQYDVPACWFSARYVKIIYSNTTLIAPVLFFPKAAIFLLYRHIFATNPAVKRAITGGLVATGIIAFPSIPLSAYYGAPHVGETWDELLISRRTEKLIYWGVVQGALSVALDIYIFSLPIPILVKLKLSPSKRAQLIGVFGTALIGVCASVIALVYRVLLLDNPDSTWQSACVGIAVVVENNVAIIVGSMPAFASFCRSHILGSSIYLSLKSSLRGTSLRVSSGNSGSRFSNEKKRSEKEVRSLPMPNTSRLGWWTNWGASHSAASSAHYDEPYVTAGEEMQPNTFLMESSPEVTLANPSPADRRHMHGVMRSVHIQQHSHFREESTDRLV